MVNGETGPGLGDDFPGLGSALCIKGELALKGSHPLYCPHRPPVNLMHLTIDGFKPFGEIGIELRKDVFRSGVYHG